MITQIRAELFKLRTTPALAVTALTAVSLSLVSALSAILVTPPGSPPLGSLAGVTHVFSQPAAVACMASFILGILVVGGEYRQRTIIGTYLAEPRRLRVLVAKAAAMSGIGALLGLLTFALTCAVVVPVYATKGIHHVTELVSVPTFVIGTVIGSACYGLIGVSLGALTRSSIGAIVGGLVWIQIVEVAILQNAAPGLAKWLPTGAAVALTSTDAHADLLAPAAAMLVLVAWGLGIAATATAISARREVH